ncbi:MAG: hypothetical protein FJ096_01505 [Deltaproteobacteria bacterium]|nr:hypothetical protein [Deltaproteobacteria bacterium]
MVKICLDCHYVNAGGARCTECGGRLVMVSDPEAKNLPDTVWKNQRVDYGARRGMILRFIAIFAGSLVGLYGLRESFGMEPPWSRVTAVGAVTLGLVIWWILHRAAARGVRVWVLAKGRVHNARLARAIFLAMMPFKRSRRSS